MQGPGPASLRFRLDHIFLALDQRGFQLVFHAHCGCGKLASPLVDSPLSRPLPAGQRGCTGLKLAFSRSSGAGSNPCAFINSAGVTPGLKKLVRHEDTQRLHLAAARQAGVGQMNMGERLPRFVPKLRRPARRPWPMAAPSPPDAERGQAASFERDGQSVLAEF